MTWKPLKQLNKSEHYTLWLCEDKEGDRSYVIFHTENEVDEFDSKLLHIAEYSLDRLEDITYTNPLVKQNHADGLVPPLRVGK